mgnify:CR=1 FL=1
MIGNKLLADLNNDDIDSIIMALEKKGMTPATINRYLATLRTMLNFSLKKMASYK